MIFMSFKKPRENEDGFDIIWIQLGHIAAIEACKEQSDRTIIEMDSGIKHVIDGFAEDILLEIVNECSRKDDRE